MTNQKAKIKNQKSKTGMRKANEFCLLPFDFFLLIFVSSLLPFSSATADEVLRDPTRPPAVLLAPGDRANAESGPVLQSVRLSRGQYTAIVSGKTVKVGDSVGNARVLRIGETEVVLKRGNGLQTLKLFPDVEKRPASIDKRKKR